MNSLVFETTKSVFVMICVGSIDSHVFKGLRDLTLVNIEVKNLGNFFHKIGIGWSLHLNNDSIITFSKYGQGIDWLDLSLYSYPDEDFCIFADFPHQKGYVPILDSANITTCTLTMEWLIQNYRFYNMNSSAFTSNSLNVFKVCNESNIFLNQTETRIWVCDVGEAQRKYSSAIEFYDFTTMTLFLDNLVAFVLIPLACFSGFTLNVLIVRAIRRNKKSELKEDFYKYMGVNSKFNCLYCFSFIFYPINKCESLSDDFFCSSIYTTYLAQYYKIVCVAYFGEGLKMCGNISYLLMTVNRYMLIGREHSPLLEKIAKLVFSFFVLALHLISATSSNMESTISKHFEQ